MVWRHAYGVWRHIGGCWRHVRKDISPGGGKLLHVIEVLRHGDRRCCCNSFLSIRTTRSTVSVEPLPSFISLVASYIHRCFKANQSGGLGARYFSFSAWRVTLKIPQDRSRGEGALPAVVAANLGYLSTTTLPAVVSPCTLTCLLVPLLLSQVEQSVSNGRHCFCGTWTFRQVIPLKSQLQLLVCSSRENCVWSKPLCRSKIVACQSA